MESTIKLYPKIEEVLSDISLACFFSPILTYTCSKNGKEYKIHLFGTDGVFTDEENTKYSESRFFGFQYNNGVYKFLGDRKSFVNYEKIPLLYSFLKDDFQKSKNKYIEKKIPFKKYFKKIETNARLSCKIDESDYEYVEFYTEAFYSYEFTKYHYELTGVHKHISVLTENYGNNNNPFLLAEFEAKSMLDEFFMNMKWNLKNDYGLNQPMYCCAVDSFRFMSLLGSYSIFAFLDDKTDIVYNLGYGS